MNLRFNGGVSAKSLTLRALFEPPDFQAKAGLGQG
jgi:hypothetical protein